MVEAINRSYTSSLSMHLFYALIWYQHTNFFIESRTWMVWFISNAFTSPSITKYCRYKRRGSVAQTRTVCTSSSWSRKSRSPSQLSLANSGLQDKRYLGASLLNHLSQMLWKKLLTEGKWDSLPFVPNKYLRRQYPLGRDRNMAPELLPNTGLSPL